MGGMAGIYGSVKQGPDYDNLPAAQPICDWAEQNVAVITGGRSGPVMLDPYQRGILEAMTDPAVRAVVMMMPSQVGKSFLDGVVITWHIDQAPDNLLLVHPTQDVRDRFTREKLSPVVKGVSDAERKIQGNNRGGLPAKGFGFEGGSLTVTTSESTGGTTGATSRVVIADEVDLYRSGGSVLSSLEQRMASMDNGKLIVSSTPTTKGSSVVEAEFARTDMREWQVPCPECGAYQVLDAWGLASEEGLRCKHCPAVWDEAARKRAIWGGEWVATNDDPETGRVGFHLSQLASLNTPLAQTIMSAKGYSARDIATQIMAVPYEDVEVAAPAPDKIKKMERPFKAVYYSVGVDVQKNTLESVLISLPWDMSAMHLEASWSTRRSDDYSCWLEFAKAMREAGKGLSRAGFPITVDGNGRWYEWVQEGLRYAFGAHNLEGDPAWITVVVGDSAPSLQKPLWGARRGRGEGYRHNIVSVDRGKADIYQAINEGRFTVAKSISNATIAEIVSEKLTVTEGRDHRSGRAGKVKYTWEPIRRGIANHALDAINYAWARASVIPPSIK